MNQPLNELGKKFLEVSNAHGFTSGAGSTLETTEKLMLVVSEIAEALEELRAGHRASEVYYVHFGTKPEGFPIELADAIIRILQLAAACNIDMDAAVATKTAYNETRPFKHGKQF